MNRQALKCHALNHIVSPALALSIDSIARYYTSTLNQLKVGGEKIHLFNFTCDCLCIDFGVYRWNRKSHQRQPARKRDRFDFGIWNGNCKLTVVRPIDCLNKSDFNSSLLLLLLRFAMSVRISLLHGVPYGEQYCIYEERKKMHSNGTSAINIQRNYNIYTRRQALIGSDSMDRIEWQTKRETEERGGRRNRNSKSDLHFSCGGSDGRTGWILFIIIKIISFGATVIVIDGELWCWPHPFSFPLKINEEWRRKTKLKQERIRPLNFISLFFSTVT